MDEKLNLVLEELRKLNTRMDKLDTRMDKLENNMNERFNAVDERFDVMDERFNEVGKRFDAIEEWQQGFVKASSAQFNSICDRIDGIDIKLDDMQHITNVNTLDIARLRSIK